MISIVIFVTIIFAYIDAEYLNNGFRFKDHSLRFILRAIVVLALCSSFAEAFLFACIFYSVFDYALNLFRGLPFLYVGSTAFSDKLFSDKYIQLGLKISLLILSIIIYI